MTYIQPEHYKKSILNFVLAGLIFTSLVGVFWLVALYNNIVNLDHTITTAKAELDTIGRDTQNTSRSTANVSPRRWDPFIQDNLAAADGLVQDNHPTYFQQSWPIASQQ
jgi:hypothetical protein